jgi:NhaC family Na+:H+ antiporter
MGMGIAIFEANPHIPMLIGVAFASLMALRLGHKWADIEQYMYDGIRQALQAIVILTIIGVLIGIWILAGVVPSMIYYGLDFLSPGIFLVATVLITSLTSLATGTSWGTAGTIGIALMGIANGLGIPPPIAAGAVVCGAYFGDKMSPLSDTTNLAPAVAGTDVFTHVKFMVKPTAVSYAITVAFFSYMGMRFNVSDVSADLSAVVEMQITLASVFNISPVLIFPPLFVIILISKKIPPIPGIVIGVILGAILAMVFQGSSFGDILKVGYDGYASKTGVESVDKLFSAGGLIKMMYSISLTIISMMFGGIMERTGQLEVILQHILKRVKSAQGLVATTLGTCFICNITMPEQCISIVVPARMYAKTYKDMGLHPKTLSNALESSGTVLSPLVPWNTCGVFMLSVLGVPALDYAPYGIFNYSMPLVVIVLSFAGVTIARLEPEAKIEPKSKNALST